MTPNTKSVLNQKVILDAYVVPKEQRMDKVLLYLALFFVFVLILGIGVWVGLSWQAVGYLFLGILTLFLIIGCLYLVKAQKIKNLEYYITENTCVDKNIVLDKEPRGIDDPSIPDDHYYLLMDPYCLVDSKHLYTTTEVGDRVYLLRSANGRVLQLFNQKAWTLDTSGFTQDEDGYFFPIADHSG